MTERTCAGCRFGEQVTPYATRCKWIDGTEDEAGDRMPSWAHEILANDRRATGSNERAETCPAYEATT